VVRLVLPALLGLAAALAAPGAAQEPPAATPASIAEVNRLISDPAQTAPRTLTFRGVVTFVSRAGDVCLQEGRDGVMIEPPADAVRPALGDEVEATAEVRFQTIDATDPDLYMRVSSIRTVAPGTLPEPERPWLVDALNGKSSRRWVEVEGVVMQAMLERGVVVLHLTDTSGWAVVNVHDWRGQTPLRDWWGARLRIRCANVGRGHRALRVTSSDQITVLRPGTDALFGAPPADLAVLRQGEPVPDRLRLEATVLAVDNGFVYLRSPAGALRASLLVPFVSAEASPHPLELIPPAVPKLEVGDHVELVGSPLRVTPWLEMSFSSFRVLGHGPPPPAVAVTGATLASSGVCDRVRVTATVKGHVQAPRGDGRFETLAMAAGGTAFDAVLESDRGGQLGLHRVNDVLELTGVVMPPEAGRPPVLRLAELRESGAPELAVVRRSLPPAVIQAIGLLAGGLALALAGAWWLQRQVRLRTAALAVANDALRAEVGVREQTQAELARSLAQEREIGELKSRFVTMVSHEFRTPLGITMSAIELLRHHHAKLDDTQRIQLFDDIQRSTRGMGELMEQVLVLGRVEAGSVGCRPVPLNLDGLAQKLTDESLSATNRRSPIRWQAENDLSGARADETLLRHIFSNLLSNAVKYSPENSPVEFTCRREGENAVFTVRDFGVGIPEADRPRLYEAFHRCANVSDIPGTGLGLVIVKRCVDLHGGSISFTSMLEAGTTFTVRLPLYRASAAPDPTPSS
jgi:signal transduction histidine kinase